ncbi:MAG: IclR family transcriptional regulator [Thermodesulfobacteriota bacterium]|nr:IclR family transcriptional regulator [Thermodesulfobacteriota bacterium]
MPNKVPEYFSTTLEKGLKILNLFDEHHPKWSQKNIAETMQMNTTSVYRLVNTLVKMGYLIKDKKTKQVSLGPMSVALGHRLLRSYSLRQMIAPIIAAKSEEYEISIEVALYTNDTMVLVCGYEQKNTLTFHKPGSARELYCTAMGKAYLAHLPPAQLDQIIARQSFYLRAPNTLTDPERLKSQLIDVRARGYSVNDGEYIKGLISIGAPLFNPVTRSVVGGISFDATTIESSVFDLIESYSAPLIDLAQQISSYLPDS